MKRYDLMHQINGRGTYMVSKFCLPHLKKSSNPHILNLAPPLDMSPKWFAGTVAYTMAKYTMSMCVLGMAEEFNAFFCIISKVPTKIRQEHLENEQFHEKIVTCRDATNENSAPGLSPSVMKYM